MSDIFDLSNCTLCPRNCHADRIAGQTGYCKSPASIHAARAALLYYEEPCISGSGLIRGHTVKGSGAIFFTGCNLGCVFCQNYDISKGVFGNNGMEVTPDSLSDTMLRLQDEENAANINLVTGSHFLPQITTAIETARSHGLYIPIVYNTASYEKKEAIEKLDGLIDIYLPDVKYYSSSIAAAYSKAPDYYDRAMEAVSEMVRQCPSPVFSDGSHELNEADDADDPLMQKGVIVRHMVMPGHTDDSRIIIKNLYEHFGDNIFISIMNQYTPMPQIKESDPLLSRTLTADEYDEVVDYAVDLGISNGFLQEDGTVSKSFIPDFDCTGLK